MLNSLYFHYSGVRHRTFEPSFQTNELIAFTFDLFNCNEIFLKLRDVLPIVWILAIILLWDLRLTGRFIKLLLRSGVNQFLRDNRSYLWGVFMFINHFENAISGIYYP
jgi:hypothetical protein